MRTRTWVLVVALATAAACSRDVGSVFTFDDGALPLASFQLFDIGAMDIESDGDLDIFTVNHSATSSVLVNDGNGQFVDRAVELGLSQSPGVPTWNDRPEELAPEEAGLHFSWYRDYVVRVEGEGTFSGALEFPLPFATNWEEGDVTTSVRGGPTESGVTVEFEIRGTGGFGVRGPDDGIAVRARLDPTIDLGDVHLGPRGARPPGHEFEVRRQDRHGFGWIDLDDDGHLDLYIARGGLRGEIETFPGSVDDELLRGQPYTDVIRTSGIAKGTCRGRHVRWTDLDADGLVDLFVGCEGGHPMMWHRTPNGRYEDVSERAGFDQVVGEAFVWVDLDGDLRGELVAVAEDRVVVWESRGLSKLEQRQELSVASNGKRAVVIVADHDRNGTVDLLVVSGRATTLLDNDDGTLTATEPQAMGLPRSVVAAAWVDVDNDGLIDLHAIPGGIYHQAAAGSFVATGDLALDPDGAGLGRVVWLDADGDGLRDCIVAHRAQRGAGGEEEGPGDDWITSFHRNTTADAGHWVAFDLVGPVGNRSAIGSVVRVTVADVTHTLPVGTSESSVYSQGHFRVYLGLGDAERADRVDVTWPDGTTETVDRPVGDELVRITYH